jgi:predicted nucleic acid-binding protein
VRDERVFLDTTVVVDALRGVESAQEAILRFRAQASVQLHGVVVAELHAGVRGKSEHRSILHLVKRFEVVLPDADDFAMCLRLFPRHHASSGTGWPDCLIAATAIRLGAAVATGNLKHFRVFRGLRLYAVQ